MRQKKKKEITKFNFLYLYNIETNKPDERYPKAIYTKIYSFSSIGLFFTYLFTLIRFFFFYHFLFYTLQYSLSTVNSRKLNIPFNFTIFFLFSFSSSLFFKILYFIHFTLLCVKLNIALLLGAINFRNPSLFPSRHILCNRRSIFVSFYLSYIQILSDPLVIFLILRNIKLGNI